MIFSLLWMLALSAKRATITAGREENGGRRKRRRRRALFWDDVERGQHALPSPHPPSPKREMEGGTTDRHRRCEGGRRRGSNSRKHRSFSFSCSLHLHSKYSFHQRASKNRKKEGMQICLIFAVISTSCKLQSSPPVFSVLGDFFQDSFLFCGTARTGNKLQLLVA